ncbi:MAG: hypothetical protein ACE5PT_12170, partial [Gemmatimonadales bacterium]
MWRRETKGLMGSLLVLGLVCLRPGAAAAQFNEPPPPAAYALQGVTMIAPDGHRTEGVTIVVHGAMIEAIGPNVEV